MAVFSGEKTRAFVLSDGSIKIIPPCGASYEAEEGEREISHNLRDIIIHLGVNDVVTAKVELYPSDISVINAAVLYFMRIDGELKEVEHVQFKDGTQAFVAQTD